MLYRRISGYIHEDEVNRDFHCLDQVIKQNTNDKEFIPWIEKLKNRYTFGMYKRTVLALINNYLF